MTKYKISKARHGLGLFANKEISSGEKILVMNGKIITYSKVLGMKKPDNAFQISRNRYIDLRRPGVIGNHSCEPNAGVTRQRELIAIKTIRKGEEITYDYSACMDCDTVCDFVCDCGMKSCRKTIKGFCTIPPKRRKAYLAAGVVQKFLEKEKKTRKSLA